MRVRHYSWSHNAHHLTVNPALYSYNTDQLFASETSHKTKQLSVSQTLCRHNTCQLSASQTLCRHNTRNLVWVGHCTVITHANSVWVRHCAVLTHPNSMWVKHYSVITHLNSVRVRLLYSHSTQQFSMNQAEIIIQTNILRDRHLMIMHNNPCLVDFRPWFSSFLAWLVCDRNLLIISPVINN